MNALHSAKTKTCTEVKLTEASITRHIETLKQKVSGYQMEHVYRELLKGVSFVQMEKKVDDFSVPMKRNVFGLFLVPVSIMEDTYWFILDTGAQISSIRESILKKHTFAKLHGQLAIGSIGGRQKDLQGYLVPHMRLGKLHIHNLPMMCLDGQDFAMKIGSMDLLSFDGILGWDILSQLDFEIDDVDKQLKIMKNRYRFTYQNMVKTTFPIFLVKDRQGRCLTMGFDSGSKTSWMCEASMKSLGYRMSEDIKVNGFGVHGLEEMQIKLVKEMDIYLYKAHVKLKNIRTGRTNIFPNVELDGILGNEILRNRRMRVINSKEMVLLA